MGSETAEMTVGWLFLLSAVPGLVSLFLGQGFLGCGFAGYSVYLGWRLLRGDDFVTEHVRALTWVRLAMGFVFLFVPPRNLLASGIDLAQSLALLTLLSDRALDRRVYGLSVGVLAVTTLLAFTPLV